MNIHKQTIIALLGILLLVSFLGVGCSPSPAAFDMKAAVDKYLTSLPDDFGAMTPAAMQAQVAAHVFVVDLRETKEVESGGYVEGSVNIPVRTFIKNLDKLPAKNQPIIVMCGSGQRSALGMAALQLLGYSNVKSLTGGLSAWKAANLPTVTGTPPVPKVGPAPDVNKDLVTALDSYFSSLPDGWGAIAPAALRDLLATMPVQLDVRETAEVAESGSISKSTNIPLRTLVKNLNKLPAGKGATIITQCSTGHKGAVAMLALSLLGYTNVRNLAGGIGAWTKAGYPVAK